MLNDADNSLKSVFSVGAFLKPENLPCEMPRIAPGKLKPTIAPLANFTSALPFSVSNQLKLACARCRQLQADLGVARQPLHVCGVRQERQCCTPVEREVGADVGGLAGRIDIQEAFAVAFVKLNFVERRFQERGF